jgi:hypothetical protein
MVSTCTTNLALPEKDGTTFANPGSIGRDSGQAQSFDLTFTTPGTYNYVCMVHDVEMSGKIIVVDSQQDIPSPSDVEKAATRSIDTALAQVPILFFQGDHMKMQRKHSLAYLGALCGTLGMAWGAHADWFYDFQTAPPASFIMGSGPPSGTFLSSAGDGVLLSDYRISNRHRPARGSAGNLHRRS